MTFMLLLSLFISLLTGFIAIHILCPERRPMKPLIILKGCLAVGLGFGISSCLFSLWLFFYSSSGKVFILVDMIFLIGLTAILFASSSVRKYPMHSEFDPHIDANSKMSRFLSMFFYSAFVLAVGAFILLSLDRPHGGWDAWAIWNMRARFIFRGGDRLDEVFSHFLAFSHPDYPLLLPLSVSRLWKYMSHETVVMPALLSMLFTFVTVGLLSCSLSLIRSKGQGLLAGLVLLGTSFFIKHGAAQYADVPLGFFFLATLVLFCLHERSLSHNNNLVSLAGITAGLSAWTKNEGILFIVSILAVRLIVIISQKGWRAYLSELRSFLIGLLPVVAIIIYFKIYIAPPNDLVSAQGLIVTSEKLLDLSRYKQVFAAYGKEAIRLGGRIVNVPFLILYLFILRVTIDSRDKIGIANAFIVLCLMLLGYFFVYITSPLDLNMHLSTSLNRLFLQLWPSLLFVYFMVVTSPEQMLSHNKEQENPVSG